MRLIFLPIVIIFACLSALIVSLFVLYPTTTPINSAHYLFDHFLHPHSKTNKHILGFLPYWRLDDAHYVKLDVLSEINYFGLTLDDNGNFITKTNNQTDPGWNGWNSQTIKDLLPQTQIMGGKFSLTIISQRNTTIESILDSQAKQQTVIANILQEVAARRLDGITIDFEYLGEPDEKYQSEFTDFSQQLAKQLKAQNPNSTLSLCLMPLAMREKGLFDFAKLPAVYDRFIGMSYDYYGISSTIAGPVAPMTGFKEKKYFFDVTTTYADYLKFIPKNKISMGIPYYGWDWAVVNGQKIQSKTYPLDDENNYAAVESYARMKTDKNLKADQCQFDEYAEETWCWYTDEKTGVDHQVWLENEKSLGTKFDFANKNQFEGIAIWVLGYDKDYPDLWNLLKEKFTSQ